MENRFDELAKALAKDQASGLSRREALWRLGGGVVGPLLASLGLERAWGAAGGNSDAAHFCGMVFPEGPLRGTCVSQAAQCMSGNHPEACAASLFFQCGGDLTRVCGATGAAFCCPSGQFCQGGPAGTTCVCSSNSQPPCNGSCCDLGKECCGGAICCDPASCCNGLCCSSGTICCNGACCGGACINNQCCPTSQLCNGLVD